MESKDYSRKYIISDEKLSNGPCELVAAYLVPGTVTTDTALYNGRNALGELIITLKVSTVDVLPFVPPLPIYCPNGLYISRGTNASGVLVQWRELKGK